MVDCIMQLALFNVLKQLIAAHKHRCKQKCRVSRKIKDKEHLHDLEDLFHHIHGKNRM